MKVLLSAYACEPGKGSEPEIGWSWARQSARLHETWVLTRTNNRAVIEAAIERRPTPHIHFVYVDLPQRLLFWKKWPGLLYLYYYLWQWMAYFKAKKLHQNIGFDLVHHSTFGMYWLPSPLVLLPLPFIWGPVGGGESTRRAFRAALGWRGSVYERLRDLAQWLGSLDPMVRLTARRSVLTLATTNDTAERLVKLGCRTIRVISSVGMDAEEVERLPFNPRKPADRFRVVSTGRLLHWKGFDMAVRAIAQLGDKVPGLEYWIFGNGPEHKRLERLAQELGVRNRVTFWSKVPREQVLARVAECDVLVHPSLHDSGAFVCLEAMAVGCPVICLDLGGPALQVSEETGVKIPAVSPEQVVRDMAAALLKLAQDPELRSRLAEAGRRRILQSFTWDKKMDILQEAYSGVSPPPALPE